MISLVKMHIFVAQVKWSQTACRSTSEEQVIWAEITLLQRPPAFVGNSPFLKATEIWGRNCPAVRPLGLQDGQPSVGVTWGLRSSTLSLIGFLSAALWQSEGFTELEAATSKCCQSKRFETVTWAHLLLVRFGFWAAEWDVGSLQAVPQPTSPP